MDNLSKMRLTAFVQRAWRFHDQQNGGNQANTVTRTARDLATHFGFLPDDAIAAVWRHGPDT